MTTRNVKLVSGEPLSVGVSASGSITIADNGLLAEDWVEVGTSGHLIPGSHFAVGADATETAANLRTAIAYYAGAAVAATSSLAVVSLAARLPGTAGNGIILGAYSAKYTLSGANLTGGTDVAGTAFVLDTDVGQALDGAKLLSLKNAGVEKLAVDKDGNVLSAGGNSTWVVKPLEGGAGIQAAILAADAAGGGIVQLMEGTYAVAARIIGMGLNNVTLRGIGRATVLDIGDLSGYPAISLGGNTTLTTAVLTGPLAKGDASVFLDSPTLYTNILEGDRLWIRGADPDSEFDGFATVAAADALPTGEVPLLSPVPRAITSPTVSVFRNGNGLRVQDLRFVSPVGTHNIAIALAYTSGAVVENVVFDRLASTDSDCLIVDGFNGRVSHCEFLGLTSRAVNLSGVYRATIDHNTVDNGGTQGVAVYGDAVETEITDNKISVSGVCVLLDSTYRHICIANNVLQNGSYGVDLGGSGLEVSAIGNTFQSCEIGFANGSYQSGKRHVVSGNTFTDCLYPVSFTNGFHCRISDNLCENLRAGGNAIMVQQGVSPAGYHTITGNVIRECPVVAIYVEDNAHTVVSNNVIVGAGLIGISLYGTGVGTGSSVGYAVVGNVVKSSGLAIEVNNAVSDSLVMGNNCVGETITMGSGDGNDFIGNKV